MLAKLFLLIFVGYGTAAHYAWRPNVEYTYNVVGRTLSGLNDQDPTMSGIFIRAELVIVPKTGDVLTAKIQNAQYSPVQRKFEEGWDAEISESELQYQPLKISQKPFEIRLQTGIVKDIVVSKDLENWEANMIKGIVSQMQLNVNAKYTVNSDLNTFPQQNSNFGVFKIMESTVTGEFETTYIMEPVSYPVWPIFPGDFEDQSQDSSENIIISKHKNFSSHGVLVGYHYGFAQLGEWEPNTDNMGSFMNRSSISNAVIFGNLEDYTIKSSNTSNIVSFNPQFNNDKSGMIASSMGIIFRSMQPGRVLDYPQNPISIGLFYQYTNVYGSNKIESAQDAPIVNDEEDAYNRPPYIRLNSIHSQGGKQNHNEYPLNQPPQYQMTPFSNGYNGNTIKSSDKIDIVRDAENMAKEIGNDLQQPNDIPKQDTTAKYAILVRLVRIMNQQEMQKVSKSIYSLESHGQKSDSWKVFRDAVAQAGTGPSLLNIREWVNSKMIQGEEAAEVIATMAESTRQPTVQYLNAFFQLVQDCTETNLQTVNDTAAISFADLLYKVSVDKEESYQQYPFHTYGSFFTAESQQVVEKYVQYLESRLHKAVAQSDSHKVLVYIRALGNVGHRDIYRVFEEYLNQNQEQRSKVPESKQVTEFQRFAIVSALDRFTDVYPEVARKILLNIYFSSSEQQEMRTLAVYKIATTKPNGDILSAMAQFTEVDTDDYVNSAVQSTIRRLVLEGYEPAINAETLLTENVYGVQYPKNMFTKYIIEEMNTEYHKDIKTVGSLETMIPEAFGCSSRVFLGRAQFRVAYQQSLISSIDELVNAFEQQTESYQNEVHQKRSQIKDNLHSSHKVYDTLRMNIEEREQLEGILSVSMGEVERFFTINNYTVDNITEFVREWEQTFRNGQTVSVTKMIMKYETILSAPTEMGVPYVINTEVPTLFRVDGQIQAESQPEISNGQLLYKPENIKAKVQLRSVFSRNAYSGIRFYTPFDHQDYASGYNKRMQVYVPVQADIKVDFAANDVSVNIKALEPEQNSKLFHYSTTPYSVRRDILSLKPASAEPHYVVLTQQTPNVQVIPFGHKSVGLTFQLHRESDDEQFTWNKFLRDVQHNGIYQSVLDVIFDKEILYSKTEVSYQGSESANREVQLYFRYLNEHYDNQGGSGITVEELQNLPSQQVNRLEHIAKKTASGIKSVQVIAVDLEAKFVGQKQVVIQTGGAYARGPVDKNSRVVAHFNKESKDSEIKPFHFGAVQFGEAPNTNGLDFDFAMKFNPTIQSSIKVAMGESKNSMSTIDITAKFNKSEERVQYLKNLLQARRCHEEMQTGNRIMPTCANMTSQANLLDNVSIHVKHAHLDRVFKQFVQKAFYLVSSCKYSETEREKFNQQNDGEIDFNARFSPDLRSANYSTQGIWTSSVQHVCTRIPVGEWERQIFVLHPVFSIATRLESKAFEINTYRPICIVDKSRAASFDGKEYDAKLSNSWTVALHHVPQFANQSEDSDLKYRTQHQIREHVVLVREESKGKAVKITLRVPRTQQTLHEIELKPTGQSNPRVQVFVDQQEVKYNQQQSIDFFNRAIRVYGLPNGEVKVEVGSDYYVIADGERIKLSATSYLFNNATRGLCGNFNGMEADDFILPNGNIEQSQPSRFVAAYTLGASSHSSSRQSGDEENQKSIFLKLPQYDQVRLWTDSQVQSEGSDSLTCFVHQTLYFQQANKDCFTIRAYPVCKPGCRQAQHHSKAVDVICVEPTNATGHWRRQVKQGGTIDFNNRQPTDKIEADIATKCKIN